LVLELQQYIDFLFNPLFFAKRVEISFIRTQRMTVPSCRLHARHCYLAEHLPAAKRDTHIAWESHTAHHLQATFTGVTFAFNRVMLIAQDAEMEVTHPPSGNRFSLPSCAFLGYRKQHQSCLF